jgi:CO/xanthine dehydrogenase Mo-binding subunit
VRRIACAHDCGLIINPSALKAQIEGNILQTLSRHCSRKSHSTARGDEHRLASYPILRFPDAPEILIELVSPAAGPAARRGRSLGHAVPAALANAVYDAVGARVTTVPFTRERVRAPSSDHLSWSATLSADHRHRDP